MQLGFVSAILPELSLAEVFQFAADEGFRCVELMCWPKGDAERRYAGVTHIDVASLADERIGQIGDLVKKHGVAISGLGYYPNPLDPNADHRRVVNDHLKRVITAARLLSVKVVNTFIGRDPAKTIRDNTPLLTEVWSDLIAHAELEGIVLGIENCPMLFSADEWPGGKNLAISPLVWRALFSEFHSPHLGLNFDPSHLIWQHIDYVRAIHEFGPNIVHVHAKDTRIARDLLYELGILGLGWHVPKLPGLGDVDWGAFFAALHDVQYQGAVCIEVEDRAFEATLDDRQRALRQSKRYLEQFVS
jgi:sugar phosphate isomerase/epimerase